MSKFFFRDKPVVGLDFSQTSLKAMSIDPKRVSVLGYGSIDLDPARVQEALETGNPAYLSSSLSTLLQEKLIGKISSNHAVMSIPTPRTYTRSFTLPLDAEGHLHDAIVLEAEQYIPVPLSQLYTDYEIIERSKDKISVLLCAVPQRIVDVCTAAARKVGLRVVMIEPSISAVARLLTHTEEGHLPTVIVDIGPANTDIAILDGAVRVTGGIAIGGNTFTIDIARRLRVPLENAHQLKVLHGLNAGPRQIEIVSALEPNLKRVTAEIKKVMRYFSERIDPDKKLEQVIIVGGGSNIPGLGDYFTNGLIMPARIASPWQVLDFSELSQPSRQFKPRYITVAGLASVDPRKILA
ncbi:cell division protein FtsA [candidate division TM7 genomosp. GTL1]|nr:cell division protein FtsA [candidate division TM7 genomosp. GTL1]